MLDRMLTRLNPKKRTVFVLFEIEGLKVDEIARVVGCPENTVWSRLHHARSEMLKMARRSAP
jgi:RNA polymerase sigma-70 factor (ECF subfamily)